MLVFALGFMALTTIPYLVAAASLLISVSSPDLPGRPYVFGHTRSYPREYLTTDTNKGSLRELAEIGLAWKVREVRTAGDLFRTGIK